jgi:hypothetical protein
MKANKELIEKEIEKLGNDYVLGCWDNAIEKISKKELKKVLDSISKSNTDVYINIKGKLYIVEISVCDDDIDFKLYSDIEYFRQYGNLEDALDNGDITQDQYNYIEARI